MFTLHFEPMRNVPKFPCWSKDENVASSATAGLVRFYEARMAELKWDGVVKQCPVTQPPDPTAGKPLDPKGMPVPMAGSGG